MGNPDKKSEEAIQSAALFPEENPSPVMRVARDGTLLYANPAGAQLLVCWNCRAGQPVPDNIHKTVLKVLESNAVTETDMACGKTIYSFSVVPIIKQDYVNLYGRDVTSRKKIEATLRTAVDNARRRHVEVASLLKASRAVVETSEFPKAARAVFDACKNLLGATAGYVALLKADGSENMVLFLDAGTMECTVDPTLPMPIRGLRAQAYRTGQAVYNNSFPESEWTKFLPSGHVRLDNVLFAPLNIAGKTLGLLGIANKPNGFDDNDARLAAVFGDFAAMALLNSRTLESLEQSEKRLNRAQEIAHLGS